MFAQPCQVLSLNTVVQKTKSLCVVDQIGIQVNPFAPRNFAEKRVLKLHTTKCSQVVFWSL